MKERVITERDIKDRLKRVAENLVPDTDSSGRPTNGRKSSIDIPNLMGHYNASKLSKLASMVILESNPQLTRAIEILSGLIVNPDGSEKSELIFEADIPKIEGDPIKLDENEVTDVVNYLKKHFTSKLGLDKRLASMVFDILSKEGADVEVYIPADLTASLIGNESVGDKDYDFFPKSEQVKTVNNNFGGYVHITNDSSTLANDLVNGMFRTGGVGTERDKKSTRGKENAKGLNIDKIMNSRRVLKEAPLVEVPKTDKASARFSAIVKTVPPEAVVPIVNGSDPTHALAYYLILDDTGHFIRVNDTIDFEQELRTASLNQKDGGVNSLMSNIASDFGLGEVSKTGNFSTAATRLYSQFTKKLEKQMVEAIKDGNYGENYRLEDDNHLAEIMFHRVLRKKKTKLVLLPASMVSYIAFFHNNSGIGTSMVMRAKLLSTLTSVLFYATYMGYLDQAIPKEKVSVTFDDADTNQQDTKEGVLQELDNKGTEVFQYASGNPGNLMHHLRRMGYQMEYNNTQNGDMPAMDIVMEAVRRDRNELDTDFLDLLNNQVTQRTGMSPQWVNDSYTPNFRAEIVRDNELVRRQVQGYTDTFCEGLTDRVIKHTLNDPVLIENCLVFLKGKKKKDGEVDESMLKLERIMTHLTVGLPQLPELGMDLNVEITENHLNMLDIVIENIIGDGVIDGVEEMDSRKIESLRANLKAHFTIEFVKRNTMFRDIAEALSDEDRLKEIVASEGDRNKTTILAAAEMARHSLRADKRARARLDKIREGSGDEPQPTPTPESSSPETESGNDDVPPATPDEGDGLPELPEQ